MSYIQFDHIYGQKRQLYFLNKQALSLLRKDDWLTLLTVRQDFQSIGCLVSPFNFYLHNIVKISYFLLHAKTFLEYIF